MMRKSLLMLIAGVFSVGVAFADSPLVIPEADFDLIPATAANPNAAFSFADDDEDGTHSFKIYDEDFKLLKEFTVPAVKFIYSHYSWYPEVTEIKKATVENLDVLEGFSSLTPEQVCEVFKQERPDWKTRIYTLDNGNVLIGIGLYRHSGIITADSYLALVNGDWYTAHVTVDKNDVVMEYLPENKDESEYEDNISPTSSIVMNSEGGEPGYYWVTRGIYSDDFNYILPVTELINFPERIDEDGVKRGESRTMIKGFTIYNVDGSKLSSISLPQGYYHHYDDNDIYYVSTAGKNYVMVQVKDISDYFDDYYRWSTFGYAVFSLDTSSRATQIAIAPAARIAPRAPKKGENVTVAVDDRFAGEKCIVNVISADGRNMLQEEINPGQKEINFNTSGFPQGVYVVTIAGKTQKIETAKIIVR